MTTFLRPDPTTALPTRVSAAQTSAGAADQGRIVALDASGKLDASLLPGTIGGRIEIVQASEALVAGDLVNIHNAAGRRVRKADASQANAAREAHGFVLTAAASGANASVLMGAEEITGLTGLTPGQVLYLSGAVAGTFTATIPVTAGHLVQRIGVVTDTTSIQWAPQILYIA